MSEVLPDPLTPADCDLQDFPFMPLHVARLRDSDLAAEGHPEGCWYAVLLWSAAWHQLPAGSLPTGEAVLARLCGLGRDLKTFRKHRGDAMRGWIECSDGRLYHPVVAEQVNASWSEKLAYRDRKAKRVAIAEKAAEARWAQSKGDTDADAQPVHDASKEDALCIADTMPKGTETGRGTGNNNTPSGLVAASRGSRLAPDWTLPREWRDWAAADLKWREDRIVAEAAKFADYWHGIAGAKGRKSDWLATWRNWCRRADEDRGGRRGGDGGFSIGGVRMNSPC